MPDKSLIFNIIEAGWPVLVGMAAIIGGFAVMRHRVNDQGQRLDQLAKKVDGHIEDQERHVDRRSWDLLMGRLDTIESLIIEALPQGKTRKDSNGR